MYDSIKTLKRNFIRGKGTAGVILPLGESDCLDWSNDTDDALGLAKLPCYMTSNSKPKTKPKP